jgi:hypothetical protein
VVQSFAISVLDDGRLATASNGKKIAFLNERTRLLLEILFDPMFRSESLQWHKTSDRDMPVTTRGGITFGDRIVVRSATTDCRHIFLSARSAGYRLATNAGIIDCSGSYLRM